jgi:hypothetical protein
MAAAFLDLAMCSASQLGATKTILSPYGLLSFLGLEDLWVTLLACTVVVLEGVGSEIRAIASHRCHRGLNSVGMALGEDSSISTGERLGELERLGLLDETDVVEMFEKDEEEDQVEEVDESEQPDSWR